MNAAQISLRRLSFNEEIACRFWNRRDSDFYVCSRLHLFTELFVSNCRHFHNEWENGKFNLEPAICRVAALSRPFRQ